MLRTDDFSPDQEIAPILLHDDDDHDEMGKYCVLDIFTAASIGDTAFVKQLLTRGTDSNKINKNGWTALMYAAIIGHNATCKLLLDCTANVDAQTNRGQTSLMLAASCGNENVSNLILQYSANLHLCDARGWTALFYATNYNHVHVVKQLLRAGADPNNPREPEGETPFLLACAKGNEQMVQTYLEYGADINYRTKNGVTAKELAYCNNHEKVSLLLENHRQACLVKGHRQLQKSNSNPTKNVSIVDGHIAFQKFLEENPNFFNQNNTNGTSSSKPTNLVVSFDKDKTLTPQSSSVNSRPKCLSELLDQLQLSKYYANFEQHEIDLHTFLQMTDTDLKEIGIKLLGPRKKMTNTIARWHQQAPAVPQDVAESAYANYHRAISDELRRKNDELNVELTSTQELVEKYKHEVQTVEMKYSNLQVSGKLCLTYVRECKKHAQMVLERVNGDTNNVEYNSSRIRALCDQILLKFAESGLI